ncbi:hypothetical protein [Sorangium sp. So ce426]|uniref:hypothetical protein n=1 Tax=unclassified Sorangium TaxID=2621164 RepID=UPI003F5C0F9E
MRGSAADAHDAAHGRCSAAGAHDAAPGRDQGGDGKGSPTMRTTQVAARKGYGAPPRPGIVDRARRAQSGQPASPRRLNRYRREDGGGGAGQT